MRFEKVRNLEVGHRIGFRSNALESYKTGDRSLDLEATVLEVWKSKDDERYMLETTSGRLKPLHRNDDLEYIPPSPNDCRGVKLRHSGATRYKGVGID